RKLKTLSKYEEVLQGALNLALERRIASLEGLDLRFMDAYRRRLADDGNAEKTRYNKSTIIRQLINFALSRNMLATDPMKGLKLKKPKPTKQPCWTYEQVQQILAASPDEVRPALTLLAETGMRFGELAWLTWDDVEPTVLRVQPKEGWKPKTGDQR